MANSFDFRTIVTGVNEDGKSVFVSDEPTPELEVAALPGTKFWLTWGTPGDTPLTTGRNAQPFTFSPFFPGVNGTRLLFVSWAPESQAQTAPVAAKDQEAQLVEAEGKLPGLLPVMEPDAPGFHITDTVDYGLLLDGELVLVLDDGQERELRPGACIIQRGTRHSWQNRSDRPALIMYVLLGAQPED